MTQEHKSIVTLARSTISDAALQQNDDARQTRRIGKSEANRGCMHDLGRHPRYRVTLGQSSLNPSYVSGKRSHSASGRLIALSAVKGRRPLADRSCSSGMEIDPKGAHSSEPWLRAIRTG